MSVLGQPMLRVEDADLLRGRARFMADLKMPEMLEAVIVRSPEAHALVTTVDVSAARVIDGVRGVFTSADLPEAAAAITRSFYQLTPQFVADAHVVVQPSREPVLAADRVRRVGEPVALVLADSRFVAEEAREAVHLELSSLPVVADARAALAEGAPEIDPLVPGNIHGRFRVEVGSPGVESGRAPHRVSGQFRIGRSVGAPIENRGVLAYCDDSNGQLTVWSTTQIPHVLRSYLSTLLEVPEGKIRVAAPAMGGSFGGGVYPEEVLVPWAAMRTGRPVRWLEERGESLVNSRHSRDQVIDAELGFDGEGRFKALRVRIVQDCGAVNPFGVTLAHNIASHIRSVYVIDHFEAEGLCVLTNKTRNTPVRGAGRPEATFVIDRLIDMAARELALDPAEIRHRNLIPSSAMPYDLGMLYRDGNPVVYDSGDFPDQLDAALDAAAYDAFRESQRQARDEGRLLGIGISCHVEGTGLGPHESAEVRVEPGGGLTVRTGSQPHGQSHATVLAQVCAQVFSVEAASVHVEAGDTALIPYGGGTFGSRSAVTAGSAVHLASSAVREKMLRIASRLLEVAEDDLVLEAGVAAPRGVPDAGVSFAELEAAARPGPACLLPEDPGLAATRYFVPPRVTFGSGTHVAKVEVDPETGVVALVDYVIVDDCGTILNPMVLDGQQHGGAAHGIGNMLFESVAYDDDGQPQNTTLMDYLLPTASDVPRFTVVHRPHPTPLNPLGAKGAGEGATSSAPAAIANAIVDALSPFGVDISEMPLGPERLVELIEAARRGRGPAIAEPAGSVAP